MAKNTEQKTPETDTPNQKTDTVKPESVKPEIVKPEETIAELRTRLDELSKALGLRPTDADMQRLHERIDSVMERLEHKINPLHFTELKPESTVPEFTAMPKTPDAWHPVTRDGMIILKYTGENGTVVSPLKGPKPLPTGVKLIVPDGYRCHVAQLRSHGKCDVLYNVYTLCAGTSAEIEVTCTARDSGKGSVGWPVSPGTEIGAAWLERI